MESFRTLVFNASPRSAGNTMALAALLLSQLPGEHAVLSAYDLAVAPCAACGGCAESGVCVMDAGDGPSPGSPMSLVWEKILWADCIVIASPLHFTGLTAPMVSIISRWQCRWNFRRPPGNERDHRRRFGAVVATGGGDYPDMFECARRVAFAGFVTLGVEMCGILAVPGMDGAGASVHFSANTRREAADLARGILSRRREDS